jgi:hypothetical protein
VWVKQRGEALLAAFMLPPLQVIAAAVNFCTLCLLNKHLFALPFEDLESIKYSEKLIRDFKKRSGFSPRTPSSSPRKTRRMDSEPAIEAVTSAMNEAYEDIPSR